MRFYFSWFMYQAVKLLGHILIPIFFEELQIVFQSGRTILHSPSKVWGSQFFNIPDNSRYFTFFFFFWFIAILVGMWNISPCGFDLHLPNSWWCWTSYMLAALLSFLDKYLFKPFAYLKIWLFVLLLSCKNSSFILDISPFSGMWFTLFFWFYRVFEVFFSRTNIFKFDEVQFIYCMLILYPATLLISSNSVCVCESSLFFSPLSV